MQFDFLICSERSGSNLITKIMDGHPDVSGPFPRHAIGTFALNNYRYGDLSRKSNWEILVDDFVSYMNCGFSLWKSKITKKLINENVEFHSLAALIKLAYEQEALANQKKRVFVKENHAYELIPFTLANFEDAKYLFFVRDPRDMALTWKEATVEGGVKAGASIWKTDQQGGIKAYGFLKDLERIVLVRFEDILLNSESETRRLCTFFDLKYKDSMLRFYENDIVNKNADHNVLGGWKDLKKPLQLSNVGRYKTELSEVEIRYIEAVCKDEMEFFGFQCDYSQDIDLKELEKQLPDEEDIVSPESVELRNKHFEKFQENIDRITQRKLFL
jgi:hypothetical protein